MLRDKQIELETGAEMWHPSGGKDDEFGNIRAQFHI